MKIYSWKDIERKCLLERDSWSDVAASLDIYPSEIIVNKKEMELPIDPVFQKMFPANYSADRRCITLDIGSEEIPVSEELAGDTTIDRIRPLFRETLYRKTAYPEKKLPVLSKRIIAFHSYKGGVGRTLSLLAFAKAWSTVFDKSERARLLIIDSDIEAPGLTWLRDPGSDDVFSYLDLLTLMQDHSDIDEIVALACSRIGSATISIETPNRTIEHVFMPTYRYKEQLLDIYASPESIVNGKSKEYLLAEVISKICERKGLSAALVDLRAGISEFSSTLLLDMRVKKYLVTSTSMQSIQGIKLILEYLMKGFFIDENSLVPEIFLTMIPPDLPDTERGLIVSDLLQCYQPALASELSSLTDNAVVELPFASELIHLASLRQIFQNLNGREMYQRIYSLVRENYGEDKLAGRQKISAAKRKDVLMSVHSLADSQLVADSNNSFDLMTTAPLKYLAKKYFDSVPQTVVMGAKGAGKTFLYRKFVEAQMWFSFCGDIQGQLCEKQDGYFLPVLATKNSGEMIPTLRKCIDKLTTSIPCAQVSPNVFLNNQALLERQNSTDTDWFKFWEELLVSSINPEFKTFQEANQLLGDCQKRIVFLIDGLEDILSNVSASEVEKKSVRVLCQDVMNWLIANCPNLGAVFFLRRDMVYDAVPVNFTQFVQNYKHAELKWSSSEALRLAVWLVSSADKNFWEHPSIGIDVASQDMIDECLLKLWGLKLGKASSNEAYSSRWILAALSDFNGQLQARDIIRFLKYVTGPSSLAAKKVPYNDRLLMPADIKKAVGDCSEEKMEEIKQEYASLKPILEKLEQLPPDAKQLPLDPAQINLSSVEEKSMIQEGYLKRDGGKFYLPESIRHSLGFKYGKGARPKVLSLTLKH